MGRQLIFLVGVVGKSHSQGNRAGSARCKAHAHYRRVCEAGGVGRVRKFMCITLGSSSRVAYVLYVGMWQVLRLSLAGISAVTSTCAAFELQQGPSACA